MSRLATIVIISCCLVVALNSSVHAQETLLDITKSDKKLAEKYYKAGEYVRAAKLFDSYLNKEENDKQTTLYAARCFYHLKQYERSADLYSQVVSSLEPDDLYYQAESLLAMGRYSDAAGVYKTYLDKRPEDSVVVQKLWRVANVQYLFEDSTHVVLTPLSINSQGSEICPVQNGNEIIFISNREVPELIHRKDIAMGTPMYKMYFSSLVADTALLGSYRYDTPKLRNRLSSGHTGPMTFSGNNKRAAGTLTMSKTENIKKQLGIQFFDTPFKDSQVVENFPYNNSFYSCTDPSLNQDGSILIFASDMKGGFGGFDLYQSEFKNGQWTTPVNLGPVINTRLDERYPFIHNDRVLYFSSDGHPGLGGLDIFKSDFQYVNEVQNVGFPLNSGYDDFSITLDSAGLHGFLASNRKAGGIDDDIYEFDIDLQVYPVEIRGLVKVKEHSWSDSSQLTILPNAKIILVDNIRNYTVFETNSDADGKFSLTIPYFSKYKIRVISENQHEHIISLNIPKHKSESVDYEMVVVKDVFK